MSRPAGPRLLSKQLEDGVHTLEIIGTEKQWALTYQGQLCGVIKLHMVSTPKYPRTIFQTRAPAENLAKKLNKIFDTTLFGVAELGVNDPAPVPEETEVGRKRIRKAKPGGSFQTNLSGVKTGGELLPGGHIRYRRKDGIELIRINSKAYPTKHIQKYAVKIEEN